LQEQCKKAFIMIFYILCYENRVFDCKGFFMKAPEEVRAKNTEQHKGGWQKALSILFTVIVIVWAISPFCLAQMGNFLKIPDTLIRADAIVVLGGDGPERLLHAAELYKKNFASNVWITGNMPFPTLPSLFEGELARDLLIKFNVPSNSITMLKSTSTWEDSLAVAANAKLRNVKSILLVTSWYHSRRALNAFERNVASHGIALGFSAPATPTFTAKDWWESEYGLTKVIEEYIKMVRYLFKYGL
jgi:uncharacterized SAM-binding protein YcdF (DUF218 family)